MNADILYWSYVSFIDINSSKICPVLLLRQDEESYFVFRITSKYENKSPFFQK